MQLSFSRPSVQRNIYDQDLPMNYLKKKKSKRKNCEKMFQRLKNPLCLPVLWNNVKQEKREQKPRG